MSDERDLWTDDEPEQSAEDAGLDEVLGMGDLSPEVPDDEDYPLLSSDVFESELEALAAYAGEESEGDEADEDAGIQSPVSPDAAELQAEEEADFTEGDDRAPYDPAAEYAAAERAAEDDVDNGMLELAGEAGRLRQPRARRFRRMVQNQLGMLPLALLLLGVGVYLLAREQDVSGVPDLANDTLAGISVLVIGFAGVFHALLSGRRERGLLFAGLWVLATAALVVALLYGVDENPALETWWPLGLWSAGLALVFTYLIERTHDTRLLLLSVIAFVAGTTAYVVSSDRIGSDALQEVAGYWPLLISVAGVGLLPLAVRRRTE